MRAVVLALLLVVGLAGALRADEDRSLEPLACVERGLPAHDRTWSGSDFQTAADCLEAIARQDPGLLPRRASARSGAVFERMCADDNVAAWRDRQLEAGVRIQTAGAMLTGVNRVMGVYVGAMSADPALQDEAAHLAAYLLRMLPPVFDVADVIQASFDPADPDAPRRKAGLDRMRGGLATMIGGALEWLAARPGSAEEDRRCLAAALGDVYPAVRGRLTPTTEAELGARLRRLADAEPEPTIKADLQRASAPPPEPPAPAPR